MLIKRPWLFALVTFPLGLFVQALSISFLSPWPSPSWLFIAVLSLGGGGRPNLAQSLGFFWGLSMDVFSLSLFGSQGWLLCAAGFVSGRFSRQLNTGKWVTQEAVVLAGTVVFWIGVRGLDKVFRPEGLRPASVVSLLGLCVLNAAAAPVAFWAMEKWMGIWSFLEGRHASR